MKNGLNKIIFVCIYIMLGIYIFNHVLNFLPRMSYDHDEIAWFYHTKYVDLLLQGKIFDPAWQSLEAYDHPPYSKYFYGLYLKYYYGDYSSQRDALVEKYGTWYALKIPDIRSTPFTTYIDQMRKPNVLGATLLLLLVSLYTFKLTQNIYIAFINTLWLTHNDKLIIILIRAVSDTHYLLLLCLSIALFLYYLENRSWKTLVISAVFGALSLSSKLIGILYFIVIPVFFTIDAIISKIKLKLYLLTLFIVVGIGLLLWLIINPTLYPAPLANSHKYFLMRQSIMIYQMNEPHNISQVLPTLQRKVSAVLCAIFDHSWMNYCADWNLTPSVYLNMILFFTGMGFLIKKSITHWDKAAMFAVIFWYITSNFIVVFSPFSWDRYYLPLYLITSVVFSCGLFSLLGSIRNSGLMLYAMAVTRKRRFL